jgi:secreted PhoX family phosphatase
VLHAGDDVAGVDFGAAPEGTPDGADANTLRLVDGHLQLVTHFERGAGAIFVTELIRDPARGFRAVRTSRVEDGVESVYNPCAAGLAPWGAHLGSEEYEPDANALEPSGAMRTPIDRGWGMEEEADNGWNARVAALPAASTPYRHGWLTEVRVDGAGASTFARRYAIGRFSHEMTVAVDARTLYLSDDQRMGGGLYRFVADADADLSAGRLEAAKWTPASGASIGSITWVDLGHVTEAEIAPAVEHPPRFDELFWRDPLTDAGCARGTAVVTGSGKECLELVPSQRVVASRLETRRYAALQGATTSFPKEEGLAWDPAHGTLWVAWSSVPSPLAAVLGVPANPCGMVVAIDVASGVARTELAGVVTGPGRCAADAIANPDNLVWAPELNTLFVAEDGGQHGHNRLWAWKGGALTAVLASQPSAEISGLSWVHVAGEGWLTMSLQDEDRASAVGFIGPF